MPWSGCSYYLSHNCEYGKIRIDDSGTMLCSHGFSYFYTDDGIIGWPKIWCTIEMHLLFKVENPFNRWFLFAPPEMGWRNNMSSDALSRVEQVTNKKS